VERGEIQQHLAAVRKAGFVAFRQKYSAHYLRHFRFAANTIIDVGVHSGTPALYRAFRAKKFVLVEPLPDSEEKCRSTFRWLNFDFYKCAAGAQDGETTFFVRLEKSWFSGSIPRKDDDAAAVSSITVPVRRLDAIIGSGKYKPPYGLKIDVEGFEVDVLRGSAGILPETEFVLVESTIKSKFDKQDRFSDLVAFLKKHGFELLDILNPTGRVNVYFDCLFVKAADHRFLDTP
jgi:FkbM family methyltransferase